MAKEYLGTESVGALFDIIDENYMSKEDEKTLSNTVKVSSALIVDALLQIKEALNNINSNGSGLTGEQIDKIIDDLLDERLGTESDISDEEIEAAIAALHSDVTLSATTV